MPKKKISPEERVKSSLRQSRTAAKKSLGQNFLIDESLLPVIVDAAGLESNDTVIEIGPGLGVLTGQLVKCAGNVIAVEIDEKLASVLRKKFTGQDNLKIIHGDILKTPLEEVINNVPAYKVVANLPYNITSPILYYFTGAAKKPRLMVIMIQKEVAEAIVAKPGNLGVLAIGMQLFATSRIVKIVPPQSFYPAPKVDSAIIRLDFLEKPAVEVDDTERFLKFVKKGFHSPRKTIQNSLQLGLNITAAEARDLLRESSFDYNRRPGELTLNEWQKLYLSAQDMKVVWD